MRKSKKGLWCRWLIVALALVSMAAKPLEDGSPQAPLGGMVYLDLNQNGMLETGEPGIGGVNLTANCNDETVVSFYSEPRTEEFGHTFATGTYGPVLTACEWTVTVEVPEGYVATTPTEQVVTMLGADRGSAKVYFGLYGSGTKTTVLPQTGVVDAVLLQGVVVFLGGGMLIAVVLGLFARRRS